MAREASKAAVQPGETGGAKRRRTHGERATANLRAAKRSLRDVPDPDQRTHLLLAEANVLALLDLADALRGLRGLSSSGAGG